MKKINILFFAVILFLSSCVSTSKTKLIPRNEILDLEKTAKNPYKQILVQWKNYSYTDYNKVNRLEKDLNTLTPQEVDDDDYIKFKKRVIEKFKESNMYDETNGTGTVKIILLTYGRWNYSELFSTFLVDTGYILILPASLKVTYRMFVTAEQNDKEYKFEKTGEVKTTFHLLLFPFYPISIFSGKEKYVIDNMLYETLIDLSKR
ncbi:MAG: hypothetical protein GX445_00665 [Elusimicrobia bacterium]|nr:hypothetical protein [Elusimicrobiota bacterium]